MRNLVVTHPAAVDADRALLLPVGPVRAASLRRALESWILAEPAAVNDWAVERLTDPAELDLAVSLLIQATDTVHRTTQEARVWAESIQDSKLRADALRSVVREWAAIDPVAARVYVERTPLIDGSVRAELLAFFVVHPVET